MNEAISLQVEDRDTVQPKEYKYLANPEQRELLAAKVEELVDSVAGSAEVPGGQGQLIFLDRSARPIAAAFREMWQAKHGQNSSDLLDQPPISFMNIGRELLTDEDERSKELGAEIEPEVDRIKSQYRYLSQAEPGTKVVIVDDICSSGGTKEAALTILGQAFPKLTFSYFPLNQVVGENDTTGEKIWESELFHEVDPFRPWSKVIIPPWKDDPKLPEGIGVLDSPTTPLTAGGYAPRDEYRNLTPAEMAQLSEENEKITGGIEQRLNGIMIFLEKLPELIDYQAATEKAYSYLRDPDKKEELDHLLLSSIENTKNRIRLVASLFAEEANKLLALRSEWGMRRQEISDRFDDLCQGIDSIRGEISEYLTDQGFGRDYAFWSSYGVFCSSIDRQFSDLTIDGYIENNIVLYDYAVKRELQVLLEELTIDYDTKGRVRKRKAAAADVRGVRAELKQLVHDHIDRKP